MREFASFASLPYHPGMIGPSNTLAVSRTRRAFVKAVGAGTLLLAADSRSGWCAPVNRAPQAVSVWVTGSDGYHVQRDVAGWKPLKVARANAIFVDVSGVKQDVLGFGGAMTDATCYLLSRMSAERRSALMHELFAKDAMALNVCRTTIGASDYSVSAYSYDESSEPDLELKKFSIDHDRTYILPILREARQVNPELFLFSSPWSPPGWMKSSNTLFGGTIREANFGPYAEYFRRFLTDYKAAGVEIDAVTVQNEVDSEQQGKMPQCIWGQQDEIAFAKQFLAPTLRAAGLQTKIWVLDHNYDLWGRVLDELSDAQLANAIDGVAWHGYLGHPSAMSLVHKQHPDKNAYWTEGGPDITQADYQTDWAKWGELFNGILNNWARSITAWNLVLDEHGKPNIGPFPCGGTVTLEASGKIVRSGQYWALCHFSRHVRRGAKVIATNSMEPLPSGGALLDENKSVALTHSAFRNPDGSLVVVLANRGEQRQTQLVLAGSSLDLVVPPDSLMTIEWGK
jgi:glucosylceramidase